MGVCFINMQLAKNSSIHTLSLNLPIILYEFVFFLLGSRCHCSVCFFLTTDDDCCDDCWGRERRRRRDLTYTVTSQGQPRQNVAAPPPGQNNSSSPEIQNSNIPMQTLQNNSENEEVITSQPPTYDEATNSVVTSQPV